MMVEPLHKHHCFRSENTTLVYSKEFLKTRSHEESFKKQRAYQLTCQFTPPDIIGDNYKIFWPFVKQCYEVGPSGFW